MTTPTNNNAPLQALLVSLRFFLCRQSVQLKDEAEKIEEDSNAEKGTTRASAFYFRKEIPGVNGKKLQTVDALAELRSYFGAWKAEHVRLTRNWDGGEVTRLLPAQLIGQYMNAKSKFEEGAPEVLQRLYANIPEWIESGPTRLGDLYDAAKFPTLDEVRSDVGWDTAIIPLPLAEQWRRIAIISPDLAQTMEATTNERIQNAVAEATKQTWDDLRKPLENIVTVLSSDRPRIFESLLGNLNSICDLVPAFNLSGDTQLSQFVAETKETLSGISADDLRKDSSLRLVTCQAAKLLLSKFGDASSRKFA